ncbi:MAG: redoxin domain-containing protein [Planctomycetota bacterium]
MNRKILIPLGAMALALAVFALPSALHAELQHTKEAKQPDLHEDKPGVATGEAAPAFTLTDTNGTSHDLADFAGKVVILEWTNKTCPYVRKFYDEGHMQGWQQAYGSRDDVVWLTIDSTNSEHPSYMDAQAWNGFAENEEIKSTAVLLDTDGQVGKAYNAKTTPHIYVIDGEGTLRYQGAIDSVRSTKTSDIEGATNYLAAAVDAVLADSEVAETTTEAYGCSIKYAK